MYILKKEKDNAPTRPREIASVPRNMKSLQCSILAMTPFPLKCLLIDFVIAL